MSRSLLDLIKAYGDARAQWAANGAPNFVPETLALIEQRIEQIRDAVYSIHGVEDTVPAILDGNE